MRGMTRLLATDVHTFALPTHDPLPPEDVLRGAPTTSSVALSGVDAVEIGLWEMTVGAARDIEVDEVFVVLSGRGVVRFHDGGVIDLRPGVAVRLSAGDRTEWTITQTLRKLYIA